MKVFNDTVSQGAALRDCITAVYMAGILKAGKPMRRKGEPAAPKEKAPTADVWEAYCTAYGRRYAVDPIRNASVNGQLAQFVTRIPAAEAPAVAAFYLTHSGGLYVSAKHPITLLLRDAEKLRTDWATNQRRDPVRSVGAAETAHQQSRRESVQRMTSGLVSKRQPSETIPMEAFDVLPDTTKLLD